jgi:hypothetical protein
MSLVDRGGYTVTLSHPDYSAPTSDSVNVEVSEGGTATVYFGVLPSG